MAFFNEAYNAYQYQSTYTTPGSSYQYQSLGPQYTAGSLVTVTITTTNFNLQTLPPDNNIPPNVQIFLKNPDGSLKLIIPTQPMIPINPNWFYVNINTQNVNGVVLQAGPYVAIATAIVQGAQVTFEKIFELVNGNGQILLPVDPISRLRLRLKDNDIYPIKWVWTDVELEEYLLGSLQEFNAAPRRTNFHWADLPIAYVTNVLKGAQISALEALATKVAQQPLTYNDKGITVNLPQQASTLQNIARELREQQEKERLRIKRQFYPKSGFITSPDIPYMSYPPLRASFRRWF